MMCAAFGGRKARRWTSHAGNGGDIKLARRSTHLFAQRALFRAKFSFAPLQIRPQYLYRGGPPLRMQDLGRVSELLIFRAPRGVGGVLSS